MRSSNRSGIVLGILLVALGAALVFYQLNPTFHAMIQIQFSWPWIIIGVGIFLLVLGLLVNAPDTAIAACIVGGIGGLLYYQNQSGDWASWSFAWTLIPGFVGVGMVLAWVLGGSAQTAREGLQSILTSIILFVIFAAIFGGLTWLGPYWPLLLVLIGLVIILQPFLRRKKS
jgi:hypothetical protein